MPVTSGYKDVFRALAELQEKMQQVTKPLTSTLEKWDKVWRPLYNDFYSEAMESYSALTKLSQSPVYTSFLTSVDTDIPIEKDFLSDEDFTEIVESSADYSTSLFDINKINQADLDYFRMRSEEVANAMSNTVFEDGIDNDVTDLIRSYIIKNKSATYNWLNELFSKNLNNSSFVEGLLRTLVMVTEKGDENSLLPIVVSGLRSEVPSEQEAAIMVIEEWRTKECLDALKTAHFESTWIKIYADKVMKELEKEIV